MTQLTQWGSYRNKQRGAVLFVSLIFLLILTLLGVMLARMQSSEERMAQNDSNHELSVEAAEAALRYAETNIANNYYTNAMFLANQGGFYSLSLNNYQSVYTQGYNWQQQAALGNTVPYASDSAVTAGVPVGQALASVPGSPQIIIENMGGTALPGNSIAPCTGYNTTQCTAAYQITVNASGGDQTASATLRSIYQIK
jgi:Tfp pilus assembly protein PilX